MSAYARFPSALLLAGLAATPAPAQPVLLVSNVNNVVLTSGGTNAPTYASGFSFAAGLAFDAANNLYVADTTGSGGAGAVYKVTPAGSVSLFASVATPQRLAFDTAGNLFASTGNGNTVSRVTPSGNVSLFASGFNGPTGLAFDANGNLYVANYFGNSVSRVAPDGSASTFASGFSGPQGLAFDSNGNLYVANALSNLIDRVSPAGSVSQFATLSSVGQGDHPEGLTFAGNGDLYVAATFSNVVYQITPGGAVTGFAAGPAFQNPHDVVLAPASVPEPGTLVLTGTTAALALARWLARGRRQVLFRSKQHLR